jgi:hypothetical protein
MLQCDSCRTRRVITHAKQQLTGLNFNHENLIMTNAINTDNSTSFNTGIMSAPTQSGMQTEAHFASVRMFPTDNTGDASSTQSSSGAAAQHAHAGHAHHAGAGGDSQAAQGADSSAQGSGNKSGSGGSDMMGAMSQIMDLIKTAISAAAQIASPIIGMFTSMMGKAGTSGSGAA